MFSLFRRSTTAFLAAIAAVVGCSDSTAPVEAKATLVLYSITPATVRSLVVQLSGPGIAPDLFVNLPVDTAGVARGSIAVLPGYPRNITVTAVDTSGIVSHRADTTLHLVAGVNPTLNLVLRPLTATAPIVVTFGSLLVTITSGPTAMLMGDTASFAATVTGGYGPPVPPASIAWASSDPSVVLFAGAKGTAMRAGTATVTASFAGATATRVVIVTAPVMNSVQQMRVLSGVEFTRVVSDGTGGVFVSGPLLASTTIAGRALTPATASDYVIVRLDSALTPVWAVQLSNAVNALAAGPGPSVYAAVDLPAGTPVLLQYVGGTLSFPSTGGTDGLIFALGSTGALGSTVRVNGGSATDVFLGVTADASGGLIVGGIFSGCCSSTGSATLVTSSGQSRVMSSIGFATGFLARINADLTIGWVARYGGRDAALVPVQLDQATSRLYAATGGPVQSTGTFVDGTGVSTNISCATPDGNCSLLASFDAASGQLYWQAPSSISAAFYPSGTAISSGSVYSVAWRGGYTYRGVERWSNTGTSTGARQLTSAGGFDDNRAGAVAGEPGGIAVVESAKDSLRVGAQVIPGGGNTYGVLLRLDGSLSLMSSLRLSGGAGTVNRLNGVVRRPDGRLVVIGLATSDAMLGASAVGAAGGLVAVVQ